MKLVGKVAWFLVALVLLASIVFTAQPAQAATGFQISGRNLLDANGNNFIMRGISHAHVWYPNETSSFANIKAAGANTVRVVLGGGRWGPSSATDVANVIQLCKTNKLICVLENHDTTGYGEDGAATSLAQAVSYWQSIQSVLTGQEAYVIINIGNEPYGNTNASGWIEATRNAIVAMRNAGFDHTLMVDAPNWGQDWQFIMRDNATSIFNSDVDRNTIFSIHMYGVFNTAAEVQSYISTFVTAGLPLVIGEFGHNHSDGDPDEDAIMATAQANGIGYIGWSWSGNGGGVEYLDMVTAFNPNQRSAWGTRIITGNNGLLQTSVEASVYGNGGTNTPGTPPITPSRTPTITPTFTFTPTQPVGGNNTGWVSPSGQASQSGGDGNGFQTSPTNAFADGGGTADDVNSGTGTSTSCTSTSKDRHAYFNYPLSIPTGSSITGIEVRTDARADSTSGTPRFCVQLSWNNGTSWTTMKTGLNLSTTERSDSFGNANDTWGRAWNTNELTSANFRVRIVSVASSTSRDFFLDWLPVRVWYSGSGPTNTPVTPITPVGPTFTPVPTNTPAGPTTLRLQYRAADTNAGDNQIKPHFNIVNPGTSAVPLSELKIRYWFTREGTASQNFWCDWAAIPGSCSSLSGTFVQVSPARSGADFYLEVGFNAAAGSIPAGGQSGEIQARFAKSDWSNYTESGDYSFDPTKTSFADWDYVTLYRNGVLVWGIEP
jgi:mannan endo-1,4-beta-mannosidase